MNNYRDGIWRPWTSEECSQEPLQPQNVLQEHGQETSSSQTTESSVLQNNTSARVQSPLSSQEHNPQNQPGPYQHKKFRLAIQRASSGTQTTYSLPQTTASTSHEIVEPVESQVTLRQQPRAEKRRPKCAHCHKTFSRISSKHRHEKTVHLGEKPHICSYCKRGFSVKTNMVKHEQIVHLGEKPFICHYCKKSFSEKRNLKLHIYTHTGEKPYTCAQCMRGFSHVSNMKKHEIIHTGKKPFKCQYCEKSFADSTSKKRHERSHFGKRMYKCKDCGKGFIQSSTRNRHERIHTKTPRKCE